MSDAVIQVEGLGKRYSLFHQGSGDRGLRHVLNEMALAPLRMFQKAREPKPETKGSAYEDFWALKEVGFSIQPGEVVGVVGRNGAGKSTLLKILSRITEPTEGRITIRGRVASLLEVGTGFHPELTGRENIFLNGAILGMPRAEIKRKFDDIVAFAEVERFIDTPVKRYSSGMYVRLAFAVAAHLEPEILIVDEVLAVGDTQFQKKCLGKMEEVSEKDGRTILFVSHNMGAVSQLCTRGIFLEGGRVTMDDSAAMVVSRYLGGRTESDEGERLLTANEAEARKRKKLFFRTLRLANHLGGATTELDVRFPFSVEADYEAVQPVRRVEMTVRILTSDGRPVMTTLQSEMTPEILDLERRGRHRIAVTFPGMFLMPGSYLLNVAAHEPNGEIFDLHEGALAFTVKDTGTVFTKYQHYSGIGVVMQSLPWKHEAI
jgi:lipopolysaccharide transport system ATP-binding protein